MTIESSLMARSTKIMPAKTCSENFPVVMNPKSVLYLENGQKGLTPIFVKESAKRWEQNPRKNARKRDKEYCMNTRLNNNPAVML